MLINYLLMGNVMDINYFILISSNDFVRLKPIILKSCSLFQIQDQITDIFMCIVLISYILSGDLYADLTV